MSGKPSHRRTPRSVPVRFYFDADVLGLARVVAGLRVDATYPGDTGIEIGRKRRCRCPVSTPETPDLTWIPIVAGNGWAIITRDRAIQRRPAEWQAVMEHKAKMFTITSRGQLSKWGLLEVFMARWRQIEELASEPGPYIYAVSYSNVRQVK